MSGGLSRLADALASEQQPQETYGTATYLRTDSDGTAWVMLAGSDMETPANGGSTVDAREGDTVTVRQDGTRLYIMGNGTTPAVGQQQVVDIVSPVQRMAEAAGAYAQSALESAGIAAAAAESAVADAARAEGKADEATASASTANAAAQSALLGLSTVEDVVDTLTWITKHGTMTLTTDTAVDPSKVYFVSDASGQYVVGGGTYSIVQNPTAEGLSGYYELTIDKSVENYIATHVAVTDEGLWLTPTSSNGYRVLIATGAGTAYTTAGTYIVDGSGNAVAKFAANGAQIGNSNEPHLELNNVKFEYTSIGTIPHFLIDNDGLYSLDPFDPMGGGVALGTTTSISDGFIQITPAAFSAGRTERTSEDGASLLVGRSNVRIGQANTANIMMDYRSMQLLDSDGDTYFHVSDLRDTSGYATYTLNATGNGERVTFTVYGCPSISEIVSATVDGVSDDNVTIGPDYPNNVTFQTAPSNGSEIVIVCKSNSAQSKAYTLGVRGESFQGINGLGAMSVAEGIGNVAAGVMSHAEGGHNLAAGRRSHVEGEGSQSTGDDAHAEGMATRAAGIGSHAEGRASQALGEFSHAQNHGTIASGDCQTAIGTWNANSGDSYALIIGNGTSASARSNALTVGWDGVVDCGGIELDTDTAPTALPLSNASVAYSDNTAPVYSRYGHVVNVCGAVKPASEVAAGGTLTIGTLPTGFRPPASVSVLCQGSNNAVWLLQVGTSGVINASRYRNGTTNAAITTSTWLPFNVTFVSTTL